MKTVNIDDINIAISENKGIESFKNEIKVEEFLKYEQKLQLVTNIVEASIDDKFVNSMLVELLKPIYIINNYTNINDGNTVLSIIGLNNLYVSSGIYEYVLSEIPKFELELLTKMIESRIEDVNLRSSVDNSLVGSLSELKTLGIKLLNSIDEIYQDGKMETFTNSISESLKDLDPSKLEYVTKFMEQVNM